MSEMLFIGDIVELKENQGKGHHYKIIHVYDVNSGIDGDEASLLDSDEREVLYDLVSISPSTTKPVTKVAFRNNLVLIAVAGEAKHKHIMNAAHKSNINTVKNNLEDAYEKSSIQEIDALTVEQYLDDSNIFKKIDEITDRDECLDMINHLELLFVIFGYEKFLEIREFVKKRLRELS